MPSAVIFGEKELARAIDRLGSEIEGRALDDAARDAAKLIAEEEKALVPQRSGRLRRGIKWLVTTRKEGVIEVDVGPDKRDFYGSFIEFGTRFASAKPFVRPGFDQALPKALAAVKHRFNEAIRRGDRG